MSWVAEELAGLEVGEVRRNRRLSKLVEDLAAQPPASLAWASGGWAEVKAAYRLLDNPALDWRDWREVHTVPAGERLQGHPVGLCLQDTTEADFTSQPGIAGLGRLSYEAPPGLEVHPTLVVTPDGVALGGIDAWMWAREPQEGPSVKESTGWLEGYEIVADWAAQVADRRLVDVADREGALRALRNLAAQRGHPADWLVRAPHTRKAAPGEKRWDRVAHTEPLGAVEFLLPAAPGRAARWVRQTLYAERVPWPAHGGAPALAVTALLAREESPPAGEQAGEWRLLTNRLAETLEQGGELIEWDRRRWLLEIFFRMLKSGSRIEALQLGTLERLERALVIYLIIAWRILQLVTWGRDCPDLPCDVVFDPAAWQAAWIVTARRPPPATPPTLGMRVPLIAGFGGFLGRQSDGHPGLQAIWQGRQRGREFALAFEARKVAYASSG